MESPHTLSVACLAAAGFAAAPSPAQTPADTYFSLAVTENSHNHAGAARLFLDFQTPPFALPAASHGEVVSTEVPGGAVHLDGDAGEWDPTYFSQIAGLVQSNYPLSEYIDAVPTDLTVGAAWDAEYVYFVVQWEDAGHDASTRLQKWIHGDQGAGETGWNQQVHTGATAGAPNAAAVNAVGHVLSGVESEDRVFFMFPIVDAEGAFAPGGRGCATYCHTNLTSDFPWQNYTGDGVVAMHANLAGDKADIWHWKAARTEPSGFADDKYLEAGVGNYNGRKDDSGTSAYFSNNLVGGAPQWMHARGLRFPWNALDVNDAVPYDGLALPGDELPRNVSRPALGSRGDVQSAARFDATSSVWTVEFRRLRDTGNPDDHSFEGTPAPPPTKPLPVPGDPILGALLYGARCGGCHQTGGDGIPGPNTWIIPRVQRAAGPHIGQAIATVSAMNGLAASVSEQQVEDIAAYLQTKATFLPTFEVSVDVQGAPGCGVVTSLPGGIDCPTSCSATYTDWAPVTLHAEPAPGFVFAGWSGPCAGTSDCNLLVTADVHVSAEFQPDCNGNGIPDGQDIASGGSTDLDANGVPDECEALGVPYCAPAVPNSTGLAARIHALGSDAVADGAFHLAVDQLPVGRPGYFLLSRTQGLVTPPSSQGDLCLGGAIGRFAAAPFLIQGPSGSIHVDLEALPTTPPSAVLPGETWNFQCWYRDDNPTATSNLSDAVSVTFR